VPNPNNILKDPRIQQIQDLLLSYTIGDYTPRGEISEKGDELDAIMIGLNTLAEEAQSSGKVIRDYERRVESIMNALLRFTLFDFSEKAEVSGSGDELDAIAIGLNTLAEELAAAKEAEEIQVANLSETNHFLDTILEYIPNMIFVKEADELRFVRFNRAGEELLGYSRDELLGRNDYDFFPKEQADFFTQKDQEALNKKEVTDIQEEEINTKHGKRWLHTKKIPIIENGRPAYLLGISEDITDIKKKERELRESEQKLRILIDGAKDYAIFMIDTNGYVLNWNKGAEFIKGYTAEEIIGKHFSVFYTKKDIENKLPETNLHLALEGGRHETEGWRVKKDGTLFWADVVFTPLYDDKNKLTGFSKITRDVTARKEAEEKVKSLNEDLARNVRKLEAANKELETFSYSVSHDLRAPLRAIHGYTKILKEEYVTKLDPDAQSMMDSVMHNAKKMGQLIDDLLSFSQLGRKELQKRETDMETMAKTVVLDLKRTMDTSQAEVIVHPLPKAVVDSNLMHQVFVNLISNALKYSSKKKKPVIEIGATEGETETTYYVKDNGTGFDMKYYDKLFGIFQRLHDSTEYEGTGVGLALVKRIILRHEGRIWAEAKPDEGATFYFTLKKQPK
jgi:PAS domain S-box-containing protein